MWLKKEELGFFFFNRDVCGTIFNSCLGNYHFVIALTNLVGLSSQNVNKVVAWRNSILMHSSSLIVHVLFVFASGSLKNIRESYIHLHYIFKTSGNTAEITKITLCSCASYTSKPHKHSVLKYINYIIINYIDITEACTGLGMDFNRGQKETA